MSGNLDLLSLALAGMVVVAVVGVCWGARTWRQRLFVGAFGLLATAIIGINAARDMDPQLSKLNEYVWIALCVLAVVGIFFELYDALRAVSRPGNKREP